MQPLTATVTNGKAVWNNKPLLVKTFKELEGKVVSVRVEEIAEWKSYLQVQYWWGLVIPLVHSAYRDLGNDITKYQAHYTLMEAIAREPIIDKTTGAILGEYTPNMSTMTKKRMIELIESAQRYGAEHLYIVIPDPDKEWKKKK